MGDHKHSIIERINGMQGMCVCGAMFFARPSKEPPMFMDGYWAEPDDEAAYVTPSLHTARLYRIAYMAGQEATS